MEDFNENINIDIFESIEDIKNKLIDLEKEEDLYE